MSAKHSHRQLHSSILWKLSGSVLLCICLMMLFNWAPKAIEWRERHLAFLKFRKKEVN